MPNTTTILNQLRLLVQLTQAEAQIARIRVGQARTDAVRRELEQNADNADQRTSLITLIEELWEAKPPRSALTTLQTYVMQLRRAIERCDDPSRGPKQVLVTRHNGYSLEVDPELVDERRYERAVQAGRRAFDLGGHVAASRLLREALGLWRGPALVDVDIGPGLALELTRLDENHMSTLERCIEAEMQLGRHHDLLSELAELTARHPMHEALCGQYMVALFRAGRQWQSLEAFNRLRATLVDELGTDPSAPTRRSLSVTAAPDRSRPPDVVGDDTRYRRPVLVRPELTQAVAEPEPDTMRSRVQALRQRRTEMLCGGDDATAKQHAKDKLTVRQRLALLLDDESFLELEGPAARCRLPRRAGRCRPHADCRHRSADLRRRPDRARRAGPHSGRERREPQPAPKRSPGRPVRSPVTSAR